jgi:hypothetical protein
MVVLTQDLFIHFSLLAIAARATSIIRSHPTLISTQKITKTPFVYSLRQTVRFTVSSIGVVSSRRKRRSEIFQSAVKKREEATIT